VLFSGALAYVFAPLIARLYFSLAQEPAPKEAA
jgi:hypothetical protein